MNYAHKKGIKKLLVEACRQTSQNKVAIDSETSSATLTNMKKEEHWDKVSVDMWKKIADYLGYKFNEYQIAETPNITMMMNMLKMAKERSITIGISDEAGRGKTAACKYFASREKNVFHVECDAHWTKRLFFKKLLSAVGARGTHLPTAEMAERVIARLQNMEKPLLILDEADKLRDDFLLFVISLFNKLDGYASIAIVGAPFLKKNIEAGKGKDKRGYKEIYSRIGGKFGYIDPVNETDVAQICEANGITDRQVAARIFNNCFTPYDDEELRKLKRQGVIDTSTIKGEIDLRKVKRAIEKHHERSQLQSN